MNGRWVILLIILLNASELKAQLFVQYETAFNRLGWAHEIGVGLIRQEHSYQVGLKLYEPDFTFEKNFPGLFFKHNWMLFSWEKAFIQTKVEVDLFFEPKANVNFWLSNLLVGFQFNRRISNHFSVNFEISTGPVLTYTRDTNTDETNRFQYFNYQAGLGIAYTFGAN